MLKRFLLLASCLILVAFPATAQRSHSSSHGSSKGSDSVSKRSSSKPVHVRSYTRKDGTVVRTYDRSLPGSKEPKTPTVREPRQTTSASALPVARNSRGRIKRSDEAKREFERETGYPHGRPGYVVDHIKPLACGGADDPSNMQWQTVAEAKAKDKTERIGCR